MNNLINTRRYPRITRQFLVRVLFCLAITASAFAQGLRPLLGAAYITVPDKLFSLIAGNDIVVAGNLRPVRVWNDTAKPPAWVTKIPSVVIELYYIRNPDNPDVDRSSTLVTSTIANATTNALDHTDFDSNVGTFQDKITANQFQSQVTLYRIYATGLDPFNNRTQVNGYIVGAVNAAATPPK